MWQACPKNKVQVSLFQETSVTASAAAVLFIKSSQVECMCKHEKERERAIL